MPKSKGKKSRADGEADSGSEPTVKADNNIEIKAGAKEKSPAVVKEKDVAEPAAGETKDGASTGPANEGSASGEENVDANGKAADANKEGEGGTGTKEPDASDAKPATGGKENTEDAPKKKTDTSDAKESDATKESKEKGERNGVATDGKQEAKDAVVSPSKQSTPQKTSRVPSTVTAQSPTANAAASSGNPATHQQPPPAAVQAQTSPSGDMDFDDGYSDTNDTLLAMTFNQDGACLAVGTGSGFRICTVNPYQETTRRTLGGDAEGSGGGIARIEMLFRTNLLALTGHSASPQYPPNKVLIYDDHLQRTIGEMSFRQKVLATKMRRDRIVVVLRDRVYIYNFSDLSLLDKVHTGENPLGLIGISTDNGGVGGSTAGVERAEAALGSGNKALRNNGMVLACPSTQRGQVRVELYGLRRTTFVDAHASALGALALSVDGSLLATASERGTVIRLFDTRGVTIGGGSMAAGTRSDTSSVSSSVPLREFRRGVERATIACLTFSLDSNWLGCASNHGTVHVFQTQGKSTAAKRTSSSSMTGKAVRMLPKLVTQPKKYLMEGEHSYAQVRGVPHPRACAFVPDREQTIAVAGMDEYGNGCLLLAEFGKSPSTGNGGVGDAAMDDSEARRLGYHRFFKCKSPASQTGRRRTKSKDNKFDTAVEGGAYIDDAPIDMKMNHISIGDEIDEGFMPIDYSESK
ncbi:hypothetical protein ACHAXT_001439 [Thalassiosira profunda]